MMLHADVWSLHDIAKGGNYSFISFKKFASDDQHGKHLKVDYV